MASPRLRKLTRWLGVGLAALFVAAQFIQPQRTNPPVESEIEAPPEVAAILERVFLSFCRFGWPRRG